MAAKKTAKKAPAKKVEEAKAPVAKKAPAAAKAPVAKKAPAKKAAAKKAPAKKASAPVQYTAEQVYSMIQQAAYFAAQNDGFQKDPSSYWAQAEAEINSMAKG